MGVVGSLPITENNDIQNEHSLLLADEDNHKTISVNHTKMCRHQKLNDHLCVKKYPLNGSSGRCLKHRRYYDKETLKHQLRCKKLRQTRRILHSTNDNIREELKRKVQQLELQQNHLLSQVEKLYLYRQQLEGLYQQVRSTRKFIFE